MVISLVPKCWHHSWHHLKQKCLMITNYTIWCVTYVYDWHDVFVVLSTRCQHHATVASMTVSVRIIWNESSFESITTYLILLCDLCRRLTWNFHCYQHHVTDVMASLPVLASEHHYWFSILANNHDTTASLSIMVLHPSLWDTKVVACCWLFIPFW